MTAMTPYGDSFFTDQERGSADSAARVVPEIVKLLSPSSVIDVGCGVAAWAAAFQKHGIRDVVGVDGDYVNRSRLNIPLDVFVAQDLEKPIRIDRRFDLAICLEVAEHLPLERSKGLVSDLTSLAPAVLFSAAIPHQGGTFHVNEQWPDFWENLFRQHEYVALDCIRSTIWNDEKIEWWYRQNIILYVHKELVGNSPTLQRLEGQQPRNVMRLIHPVLFQHVAQRADHPSLRSIMQELPAAAIRAVEHRARRIFR